MKSPNSTELSKEGRSGLIKILIAFCIVVVIGAVAVGIVTVYNTNFALPDKAIAIENVFVDIDGDGKLDFVRYAEVIINTGNLNLTSSP
jgi:predicted small integral membrane protein